MGHVFRMTLGLATHPPSAAHGAHRRSWSTHATAVGASAVGAAVRAGRPRAPGLEGLPPWQVLQERGHSAPMNSAFFAHSPSLAQSSHLMSSSAHRPGGASSPLAPHQPHVRWQCFAMKRRLRVHCASRFHASQSGSRSRQRFAQRLHERRHLSAMYSALAERVQRPAVWGGVGRYQGTGKQGG